MFWRLLLGDRQRSPAARGAAESRPEGDGLPAQAGGCEAHAPRRGGVAASGWPGWTSLAHHQPPSRDRLRRGARLSHLCVLLVRLLAATRSLLITQAASNTRTRLSIVQYLSEKRM